MNSEQAVKDSNEPDVGQFLFLLAIGSIPIIITILIAYFAGTTNQNPM